MGYITPVIRSRAGGTEEEWHSELSQLQNFAVSLLLITYCSHFALYDTNVDTGGELPGMPQPS
jgi:hypothetical protein